MELDLTNHLSLEDFFSNDTKVLTFDVNFVTAKRDNDLIVPTMPIEVFAPSIQFAESISLDTVIVPCHQLSVQACLEAENIPENSRDYTIPVLLSMSNITDNSKHNETYQVLPFYFEQNTNQSCYTLERPTHNVNSAYTFSAFIENDLDANQFYRIGNRNNISIVWKQNDNYIVKPSTTTIQPDTSTTFHVTTNQSTTITHHGVTSPAIYVTATQNTPTVHAPITQSTPGITVIVLPVIASIVSCVLITTTSGCLYYFYNKNKQKSIIAKLEKDLVHTHPIVLKTKKHAQTDPVNRTNSTDQAQIETFTLAQPGKEKDHLCDHATTEITIEMGNNNNKSLTTNQA